MNKSVVSSIALVIAATFFVAIVADTTSLARKHFTEPCAVVTVNEGKALCVTQSGQVRAIKQL